MKVLVAGGRNYSNGIHLFATLDHLHADRGPIHCVVHGAARGADLLAEEWAKSREIPYRGYPAPWHTHGEWCRCPFPLPKVCKAAGAYRNDLMLRAEHLLKPIDSQRITVCVAFEGATGTADMVRRARAVGIEVIPG